MTGPPGGGPPASPGASEPVEPTDLRMPVLGAVAWLCAVAALRAPAWVLLGLASGAAAYLGWRRWRGRRVLTVLGWLVTGSGVAVSAILRAQAVAESPVATLADERATVQVRLVVTSDPVLRQGRREDYVVVRGRAVLVTGRGRVVRVRAPVLVLADARWRRVRLGSEIRTAGRLQPARTRDLAAVLTPRGPPAVLAHPGVLLRGAAGLRASVRAAVERQPAGPRALVPALVDGDETGISPATAADFRTAGLTHLLAVSGTNLTLVVGSLLVLARWLGVRARGLFVVGALGVVGFVLLARPEPSVLRAAVMGSVALVGLGPHGRRRGPRTLGAAVLLLLLVDPWLAVAPGFALSVLATAGIIWLAPGWRDRMARWLPRWVAEAVSVPLAAQLACTPLVAAISAQVSLVAVVANLLAAPAVGPATVLGLAGGVVGLGWAEAGRWVAAPAAWCAGWVIAVARRSADLPVAAVGWSDGWVGISALTVGCLSLALVIGPILQRRVAALGSSALLVMTMLVPLPSPGWPPRGWVMVACDVGQGDGLVLAAGPGTAVVVDAGPDPVAIDRCLRALDVQRVEVLVLTHFHADHVDGAAGVFRSRSVGTVVMSSLPDPVAGVRRVQALTDRAGVPLRVASYGETRVLGPLTWQVVAPSRPPPGDSASPPNDASVVLLVETRGIRLLLLGDEETGSQARLRRETGGLRADVLKVAHHGSARQDPDLVRATGARLAIVSVGVDNDYGHPAPSLVALLRDAGMRVARTDRDGDVAVVVRQGRILVVTRPARRSR